jgi:dTDP-4-dehydrorhamnose reductase
MKILLFGKNGQLGWELRRSLPSIGEVIATDADEIDLTDRIRVRDFIRSTGPDVIINASAYTAVDKAESESGLALAINAHAPTLMAEEADRLKALLIHYSTDYVFDGRKGTRYVETDSTNPLNVYGKTKLAGEQGIQSVGGRALILRTSWVYTTRRDSFVTKVLKWARQQTTLRIVSDQVGSPTWARTLAETGAQLLALYLQGGENWIDQKRGLYHLANGGAVSRLEWAQAILKNDPKPEEQIAREILPAPTSDFPTPAERPLYSALDCGKFESTFGLRVPGWDEALQLAMTPQE